MPNLMSPNEKKQSSAEDLRNAKLVGILMMAALMLQEEVTDAGNAELHELEAAKRMCARHAGFINAMARMFPQQGQMQREVSALSECMGFGIEVTLLQDGSPTPQ